MLLLPEKKASIHDGMVTSSSGMVKVTMPMGSMWFHGIIGDKMPQMSYLNGEIVAAVIRGWS